MVAELTWPPNRPRFSDRDASLEMFVQRINVIVRSHTNERIATMTKQRNTRNINRYKRKKKRKKVQGKESGTPRRDHGKSGSKPLNERIRVPVHGFVSGSRKQVSGGIRSCTQTVRRRMDEYAAKKRASCSNFERIQSELLLQ